MSGEKRLPGPKVTREILRRLLRRAKAYRTTAVAKEMGVEIPYGAQDAIVATNGVELEAEHLIKMLSSALDQTKRDGAVARSKQRPTGPTGPPGGRRA